MSDIVPRRELDELLDVRRQALEHVEEAFERLAAALALAEEARIRWPLEGYLSRESLYGLGRTHTREKLVAGARKDFDRGLWRELMNRTHLASVMDSTARAEWEERLQKNPPPCTAETLEAIFEGLRENRELDYFGVRVFKNGNAHVTFRRPDLVERCNRIIAAYYGDAMPDGRRAA